MNSDRQRPSNNSLINKLKTDDKKKLKENIQMKRLRMVI